MFSAEVEDDVWQSSCQEQNIIHQQQEAMLSRRVQEGLKEHQITGD